MTPAHEFKDGRDYVPANKFVLLGHHFTSIAGAAPIVGPAIAVYCPPRPSSQPEQLTLGSGSGSHRLLVESAHMLCQAKRIGRATSTSRMCNVIAWKRDEIRPHESYKK